MGGVLADFFKKITLNFLTSGAEVRLFTNMFLKIDLRFDFFRPKIRVVRWHGEGFELFFESVNTLIVSLCC